MKIRLWAYVLLKVCNVGLDGPFLIVSEREWITYLLLFNASPQKEISKFDIIINVLHWTIKMNPNLLYKSIHSFRKVCTIPVYCWWRYLKGSCHSNSVIPFLFFAWNSKENSLIFIGEWICSIYLFIYLFKGCPKLGKILLLCPNFQVCFLCECL